jgi:uncharacterized protein
MKEEKVTFYSEGCKIVGLLRTPDAPGADPLPVIINGPGWLGLADSPIPALYHEAFTKAGYAVLSVEYRGFGESEGERGWVVPDRQLEDLFNAITYIETRKDLDINRLGCYGQGGTGGGNAIVLAALEPRIKCVVAQTVVANGVDWLRSMRREYEWIEMLNRVNANHRRRVLEGKGEMVDPREGLMVATPERKAEPSRKGTDQKVGADFHLASAEFLLRYRPIDYVHRIAPRGLLMTSIENDVVTPEEHAIALYEKAEAPKKLIRQTGTNHYRCYKDNFSVLVPQFLDWYDRFLKHGANTSREQRPLEEIVPLPSPQRSS